MTTTNIQITIPPPKGYYATRAGPCGTAWKPPWASTSSKTQKNTTKYNQTNTYKG